MSEIYGTSFYDSQKSGSFNSAKVVVPWVVDVLRPTSVIDVGCGIGTWASAYRECGVTKVIGIDGDYVNRAALAIPAETFLSVDLVSPPNPETFGRFDLVNCLEVAEHLPATSADAVVAFLTGLADVVLFGAAIPGQGGTYHINEQPQSYWIERFDGHGFKPIDAIRPRFWQGDVEWWYAQNTFLFATPDKYINLAAQSGTLPDVVHPRLYAKRMTELRMARKELATLKGLVKQAPGDQKAGAG